jgi:hypothetical protein
MGKGMIDRIIREGIEETRKKKFKGREVVNGIGVRAVNVKSRLRTFRFTACEDLLHAWHFSS